VALADGQLVASGQVGALMTVTGRGDTVEAAREAAYARAAGVVIPRLRYRTDIGLRFLARDRVEMERLGLWKDP
jgi:phosphoribosylamine--glycine ligase